MDEGDEQAANEFRLNYPGETSVYLSAQSFTSNVINVVRESAYRFFETVVDGIIDLTEKTHAEGGYGAFTYHWQHKVAASKTWTNIFEATGKTYRPPVLSQSMQYRRVATNAGCGSAASNTVDITVLDPVAAGEIETEKQQICHGTSPGTLLSKQSASGANGQFSYQWRQRTAPSGEWSDITGAGATMYTPPGLTQSMQYKRVATNMDCGSASSNILTITVQVEFLGRRTKDRTKPLGIFQSFRERDCKSACYK